MLLLLGFGLLTLLGLVAIVPMKRSLEPIESIAVAFGVGAGMATLGFFVVAVAGVTLSGMHMVLVILAALVLLAIAHARRKPNLHGLLPRGIQRPCLNSLDVVLILTIMFISGAVLLIAIYWPPYSWDAIAIWVAKARAVYASQNLKGLEWGAFPFYPPHLPLLLAFFLHLAPLHAVKLVFPCYYVSLLLVFGVSLSRFCGRTTSLGFTLLLATVPYLMYQATIAYADLTFTFYYTSSALLLHRFMKCSDNSGRSSLLLLSGLMVGIACWTRPEGLMYFAINSLVLLAFSKRNRVSPAPLLRYGIAFAVFGTPWMVYSNVMGYENYVFGHTVSTLGELSHLRVYWDQVAGILTYFGQQTVDFGVWGFLWILFALAVVLYPHRAMKEGALVGVIGLNILGLFFTYYATRGDNTLSWWLETGFNRMALHFAPLLLFYCGLCFNQDLAAWLARWAAWPGRCVTGCPGKGRARGHRRAPARPLPPARW